MRLLDLVRKEPVTCDPNTPLKEVVRLMNEKGVGSVVVTRGDTVLGIFTERDLVKAIDSGTSLDEPVARYMTEEPVTAHPEESLESALQKMLAKGIRHLPVVTSDKRLLGVVSIKDLVEAMLEASAPI